MTSLPKSAKLTTEATTFCLIPSARSTILRRVFGQSGGRGSAAPDQYWPDCSGGFDFTGFDWGSTGATGSGGGGSSFRDIFPIYLAAALQRARTTEATADTPTILKCRSLSFEEAIQGLTTSLNVNRSEQCSRCQAQATRGQ